MGEEEEEEEGKIRNLVFAFIRELERMGLGEEREGAAAPSASPSASAVSCSSGPGVVQGVSKSSATLVGRSEYEGHMANSNIVLFGTLHERSMRLMSRMAVVAQGFVGADIPYRKYVFDVDVDVDGTRYGFPPPPTPIHMSSLTRPTTSSRLTRRGFFLLLFSAILLLPCPRV